MKYDSRPCLVCPMCGNPKIYTSSWLDGWITPEKYICGKCGYKGFILMEIDKKELQTRKSSDPKIE